MIPNIDITIYIAYTTYVYTHIPVQKIYLFEEKILARIVLSYKSSKFSLKKKKVEKFGFTRKERSMLSPNLSGEITINIFTIVSEQFQARINNITDAIMRQLPNNILLAF